MEHAATPGLPAPLSMLLDNPLLILLIIFGVGGWFVYRMSTTTDSKGQSENSASNRGA